MKPIPTTHARRRFTAVRDSSGVPHIAASSWRGVLYGLGYMHAVDRPTQMVFSRAIANGRACELIADKPELLETDRFFRRVGLFLRIDSEVNALDDRTFDQLTAYCEGINDGMKHSGRSLPMWATGFVPTPWTQASVLLIGALLSYGGLVVGQQQNEHILVDLIQAGVADEKMRELFDPDLDHADFDLLRKVKISSQLSDEALELISDLPRLAGSNAWAIAPSRSASGGALLASDPHLEVNRLPAIWYETVLSWGDQYLMGATLPGCPLFAVARNKRLGWGVTYLKGDTSDYFVEQCRPGGTTGWQYRRGKSWHDFQVREERIGRKGAATETLRVLHNPQGFLDRDPQPDQEDYYLSVAWIGDGEGSGRAIATWLDVTAADSVAAAQLVASQCPHPTLCWMFADREGNIGQQANGWFPRRSRGHSGLFPVPAWETRYHWRGRLPATVLPQRSNPSEGFLATANENLNSTFGPKLITLTVPDYRKRRIVERLAEMPLATLGDMQRLQYDMVNVQARDLLPVFLPHLPEGELKRRLSRWDCSFHPESREATLFNALYRNVLLEIFGHEQGIGWRRMLYICTRMGFSTMVLTCIDQLLQKEHSIWWQGRNKGELIRRAAEATEREPLVPWSVTNGFHFSNRFLESHWMGRALGFHTGEMAMPGCHATVFQGHLLKSARRETTFAPSYHFVTDMSTDEAWSNLPGGPSESVISPYYKNDIRRWRSGEYKRLTVQPQE